MTKIPFEKMIEFKKYFSLKEIRIIFKIFSEAGVQCRIVGGSIRDILMGKNVNDVDFAVAVAPNDVSQIIKNFNELNENLKNQNKNEWNFLDKILVIETGLKHGTLTLNINRKNFEITSLRIDKNCDGRHAEVLFTDDFSLDSNRRDFTINAFYMDENYNFFDYHAGLTDLKNLKLKFIRNPSERIREDYLRILRYYRFLAVLNENENQCKQNKTDEDVLFHKEKLLEISKERIQEELLKMIKIKNVQNIFSLMNFDGISSTLFKINFNVQNFIKTKKKTIEFNEKFKEMFFLLVEKNFCKNQNQELLKNNLHKNFSHLESFFLIESLFYSENNFDYDNFENEIFLFRKFFKFSKKDFSFLKELQKIQFDLKKKLNVLAKKNDENKNSFLKKIAKKIFYIVIINRMEESEKYFYLLKIIIFLNEINLNSEAQSNQFFILESEIKELMTKIFILKNFPLNGFDVMKNFRTVRKDLISKIIFETKMFWLQKIDINKESQNEKFECLEFINEYLKNLKN